MNHQPSSEYSFIRYLSAKISVDDRALNRHVLEKLKAILPAASRDNRLRVLEIGAGIGTMIERLLDWNILRHADYTALDADARNIVESQKRLARWAAARNIEYYPGGKNSSLLHLASGRVSVTFDRMDIYDYFGKEKNTRQQDLLIAHAFMDLVDLPAVIPNICALMKPGGLVYVTLNFDGETILLPVVDPKMDEQIIGLYHRSMDERSVDGKQAGDSQTGRKLVGQLQKADARILAAGSSDWFVFPTDGLYQQDEAYFLHYIIQTIYDELQGHPSLDSHMFKTWADERHAQIERGELIYIAKQLDYLAQVSTAS
jgi:SAM-dependent methyltransferase